MEIYKNFTMGGLFQAGKRMAPPWGAFRRFTNAFKDSTGKLKPYGRGPAVSNTTAEITAAGAFHLGPVATQRFKSGLLQLHACESLVGQYFGLLSYHGADNTNIPIMQPFSLYYLNSVSMQQHMTKLPAHNLSSCTVSRKSYISSMVNENEYSTAKDIDGYTPKEAYLLSFDGQRVRGAGLPRPWKFCNQGAANGAHYVRGVYFTIGMDAEPIFSGYQQLRLDTATPTIYFGGYTAYPATKVTAPVVGFEPTYRDPHDTLFEETLEGVSGYTGWGAAGSNARYFDKRFIHWSGSGAGPSSPAGVLTIGYNTISAAVKVGDWIQLAMGFYGGTISMFKVTSINTGTKVVTMVDTFKELDPNTLTWVEHSWSAFYNTLIAISVDSWLQVQGTMYQMLGFTNIHQIIAYSTTAASGYVTNRILPIFWDSAVSYALAFTGAPWTSVGDVQLFAGVVNLGGYMTDWYDFNAVKTTFPPVKGITNYKELLVAHDDNALYFTDVTLGGSTEMVSGLSNLVPYGSEYGKIVAVCGSEDFLYVARERKNYIITGDIAGSSINISECDFAIPGAYNTRAASNAWAGQVIFANKAGVFAVTSNGSISDIGKEIKGLFIDENRDNNLFKKDIFKNLIQTRTDGFDGGIVKFFLEETRGFVILLTAKIVNGAFFEVNDSNMLVYDTKDGKWYEFNCPNATSAEAIYGNIISLGTYKYQEDGVMRDDEKQLLVTQRMTVDQPSLEKQMLQVKLFGEITETDADVRGVTIGQLNDWEDFDDADRTNWTTDTAYNPESHQTYAHKKRFNSSKPVATSIILESLPTGSFTLDGMEVEGVVTQQGIKK